MGAGRDNLPSLADLRRKRRRSGAATASLFDFMAEETVVEENPALAPQSERPELSIPEPASPVKAAMSPQPETPQPAIAATRQQEQPAAQPRVWSVSELMRQVRGQIERGYGAVSVEGEISNWRPASSGHCYFTLKDGAAQLAIVMFRAQAQRLRFKPKDGDAVRLSGQLSVYEGRSQMQLIAETMTQVGLGALLEAVRQLKEKLRREGLFDRKRPLPSFPKCIGVVTSLNGAALRDIVKVCRRRHAAVNLLVYPAAVQGPRCAIEVERGVRWFSAHPERADVVIVARGGGSWEDLHGFDDERVARAIAACAVPVIAGIGHATDSTIADAAADVCAPTPSAAAELVTAAQFRVEERVLRLEARVLRAGRYQMLHARQRFSRLSAEMVLRRVEDALGRRAQRLDELEFRAQAALRRQVEQRHVRLARVEDRLRRKRVEAVFAENNRLLQSLTLRLEQATATVQRDRMGRLDRATLRLDALSPLRVLERGYALVYSAQGKLLRVVEEVREGDAITARLHRGRIRASVESTE